MVTLSNGLSISLRILEQLRQDELLKDYEVTVKAFANGRESGLTYKIDCHEVKGKFEYFKPFTFCTYEHRNSDKIIINGKEGYHDGAGDLPYKGDKYQYLAEFAYNEPYEAAERLSQLIREYADTMYRKAREENKNLIKELESGTIEFDPTNPLMK
jgi:hypothetical protein